MRSLEFDSISFRPAVPIARILGSGRIIDGSVTGFHVVSDRPALMTRKTFSQIMQSVLSLQIPVRPNQIPFSELAASEHDLALGGQFNYAIVNLASAKVTPEGYIQAWVGPTLVHRDCPLALPRQGNHMLIETGGSVPPKQDWREDILPEEQFVTAYYVRTTVTNQPSVLSQVLGKIARQGLNVCELRQVEPQQDQPVEIAILLDACETGRVQQAVANIRSLHTCIAVNATYRVLGEPTPDISRKYNHR